MVGCGPAGASAARRAAGAGLSVMIVDRRRAVGQPNRCAGYVPAWLPERAGVDPSSLIQPIDGVRVLTGGKETELDSAGWVIDRVRFDKTLAILAMEAGADLCNAFVLSRDGCDLTARRNGIEAMFRGRIVVAADGASSVVARNVDAPAPHYLSALQYEVGLSREEGWIELIYPLDGETGYGWFVPGGRTARIGVAVERSRARVLKRVMNGLVGRYERASRIVSGSVLSATGGLIPVSRRTLAADREVIPAGDACGFTGPLGGAGAAVILGELSGATAAATLTEDTDEHLKSYEKEALELLPPPPIVPEEPTRLTQEGLEMLLRWQPPPCPR